MASRPLILYETIRAPHGVERRRGRDVVDMIVTDLAVFARSDHGSPVRLIEPAPGNPADEIAAYDS